MDMIGTKTENYISTFVNYLHVINMVKTRYELTDGVEARARAFIDDGTHINMRSLVNTAVAWYIDELNRRRDLAPMKTKRGE